MTKVLYLFFIFLIYTGTSLALTPEEIGPLHLHPFDTEVPAKMKVPEEFPLGPGRLVVCDTCHGVRGLKDRPLKDIDRNDIDFLRGGLYGKLEKFCSRCHEEKDLKRPNIHKMLDEKEKLVKDNCEFCHMETPDPEKVGRGGPVWPLQRQGNHTGLPLQFRLPVEKLCLGCHLKTPHLNASNHLKKPSEEMKKVMDASEKRHNIIMPLDEEGRITCVTCHSSHEKGIVKEDRPGGKQVADTTLEEGIVYQGSPWNRIFMEDKKVRLEKLEKESGKRFEIKYMRIKKEVLLRLPAKDGTLCRACHEFKR